MAPHGNRGAPLVATVRLGRAVLHGAELDAFSGGARARLDAPC
jgi:hypothetical protein